MKKIKVLKTVPILKNPDTGTYYKQGEEIKNPTDIILQVAKVHPDVFSIIEVVEEKIKDIKNEVKKIVNNVKKIEDTIVQDTKIANKKEIKKVTINKKKIRRKSKKSLINLEGEE